MSGNSWPHQTCFIAQYSQQVEFIIIQFTATATAATSAAAAAGTYSWLLVK